MSSDVEPATFHSPVEANRRQRVSTSNSMLSEFMNKSLVHNPADIGILTVHVMHLSGFCICFRWSPRWHSIHQDRKAVRRKLYSNRIIESVVIVKYTVSLSTSLFLAQSQLHAASGACQQFNDHLIGRLEFEITMFIDFVTFQFNACHRMDVYCRSVGSYLIIHVLRFQCTAAFFKYKHWLQCQLASHRCQQRTAFRGAWPFRSKDFVINLKTKNRELFTFCVNQVGGVGLDATALDSELNAVRRRNQVLLSKSELLIFFYDFSHVYSGPIKSTPNFRKFRWCHAIFIESRCRRVKESQCNVTRCKQEIVSNV